MPLGSNLLLFSFKILSCQSDLWHHSEGIVTLRPRKMHVRRHVLQSMLEAESFHPAVFSEQKTGSVNWRNETFIKHKDGWKQISPLFLCTVLFTDTDSSVIVIYHISLNNINE